MFANNEFEHAVGADLDYGFNWVAKKWLQEDESITSSVWAVEDGVTKSEEQNMNGVTSLFISGGEDGQMYRITNTITTSQGRTDSRSIILICKQR